MDVPDKYELGSDEWLDLMRELIERALAGADLTGLRMAFYEEYMDAPTHLVSDGGSSLIYHVEITEAGVTVGRGRISDPLFYVEADYQGMLVIAHTSKKDPELVAIVEQLQEKGQFRHVQVRHPSTVPADIASRLDGLHDDLLRHTK